MKNKIYKNTPENRHFHIKEKKLKKTSLFSLLTPIKAKFRLKRWQ